MGSSLPLLGTVLMCRANRLLYSSTVAGHLRALGFVGQALHAVWRSLGGGYHMIKDFGEEQVVKLL